MTKINENPWKHDLVQKFINDFRYLDDALALNNPEFQNFVKEINHKNLLWVNLISIVIVLSF